MTRIADVIVPEVFNDYVIQRTSELSELERSGIIANNPELDALATSGGRILNMPFWDDLYGDDEVLDDEEGLKPDKITAGNDQAILLMRGKAWTANDLAKALSGDDPMQAIGDLVAGYWARRRQKMLISILEGVFGSDSMKDNILDISKKESNNSFVAETFLDAAYKLGDAEEKLKGLAVHSATFASMRKQDLIEFIKDSDNKPIATYMGKRVFVDDGLPNKNGVYTSYIFGERAIGLGNGKAPVPTETDREALKGNDILINRQHQILHPRGVKFTDTVVEKASPSNAELANPKNWNRVYEPKNVRIVAFKHKLENIQ